MHSELQHLGEVLRSERERKGLSLREVESATSIRLAYLQAMEEGHIGKLISPVYAQGFLKKYAAFLDLDGDALFQAHPFVQKVLATPSEQSEDFFSLGVGSLEMRSSPAGEVKWLPNLLWVGGSVGIVLLGWYLAHLFGLLSNIPM
ncbi:MAG: hypothetical protein K940chlam9_00183 [Chlamydiae bacterium]|nr:hypothetical protein [Chlamydiota bacterium]